MQTIDDYINGAASEVQPILLQIRAVIQEAVPSAQETISYKMPAFKLKRTFIYFAAFKKHIGVYPPVNNPSLRRRLAPYANARGNLAFPLSEPIPIALIAELAQALAAQYAAQTTGDV